MSRILIVDDEQHYLEHLSAALSRDGHEVRTAASGREGIALGSRFRPDVLIADWMLKNHIHGLSVSDTLRAVLPDLRIILITGFPPSELRDSAREAGIGDFIEKPFSLERMKTAVRNVQSLLVPAYRRAFLAVIEVALDGSILYANWAARDLLGATEAGAEARHLAEVFPEDATPDLDAAATRWMVVSPRAPRPVVWHLRSQAPWADKSRLVVLRRQDEPQHAGLALVEMLLGVLENRPIRWPFTERVLVVDRDVIGRRTAVSLLESTGATCYGVATLPDGLPLLSNDDGLRFVAIDSESTSDLAGAVAEIRKVRQDTTILGTSNENRRELFASAGVDLFMRKPWRMENLVNLLTGRLGNCLECGLQMPLRRARPGESPLSWACNFCGARYLGVVDDGIPANIVANARLVR
jgi:DNA-binding response OmpR family regulator